jgi:hypothetical protein
MRQLAGRTVIFELEHKVNGCRVGLSRAEKKSSFWEGRDVGTKGGRIVLNPASVLEFPGHGPPR